MAVSDVLALAVWALEPAIAFAAARRRSTGRSQ
jgi:hypothetical protein